MTPDQFVALVARMEPSGTGDYEWTESAALALDRLISEARAIVAPLACVQCGTVIAQGSLAAGDGIHATVRDGSRSYTGRIV